MLLYHTRRFTLTTLPGPAHIASWVFLPHGVPQALVLCLPGGSESKAYAHVVVDKHRVDDYSIARYLAQHGYLVVAIDHLGTAESSPLPPDLQHPEKLMVQANAEVVAQLRQQVAAGTLFAELPPLEELPVIGIGHSLGAQLAILQQERYHSFDALALLGWSNRPLQFFGTEQNLARVVGIEPGTDVQSVINEAIASKQEHLASLRAALRPLFYLADVPLEVMLADEAGAVPIPSGLAYINNPTAMLQAARQMTVPLFLVAGSVDVTKDIHREALDYPQSHDIRMFSFPSGHAHYLAGERRQLWRALDLWMKSLPLKGEQPSCNQADPRIHSGPQAFAILLAYLYERGRSEERAPFGQTREQFVEAALRCPDGVRVAGLACLERLEIDTTVLRPWLQDTDVSALESSVISALFEQERSRLLGLTYSLGASVGQPL